MKAPRDIFCCSFFFGPGKYVVSSNIVFGWAALVDSVQGGENAKRSGWLTHDCGNGKMRRIKF
jgi:hypothetical protein